MLLRKIIAITLIIVTANLIVSIRNPGAAAAEVRIAVLVSSDQTPFDQALEGFQQALSEQSPKVDYDVYRLERDNENTAKVIQELRKGNLSLVYVLGSIATDTALKEIKDTPIISCMVLRQDNLKKSENATGVSLEFPLETQFHRLRKVLPEAKTVGVLYNPAENAEKIEAASKMAREMGFQLESYPVNHPREMPVALDLMSKKADVIWGLADRIVLTPQTAKNILLFSFRNRIPFIGLSPAWVKAGALYSLESDYKDIGKQCGEIAIKVLQGVSVSSIPPTTPRTVGFSMNLRTAKHMKVEIPERMIRDACQVF